VSCWCTSPRSRSYSRRPPTDADNGSDPEIVHRLISAERLPFADKAFDLVVSINTLHNLERADCIRALGAIERVSRRHRYVQVDLWLNETQREKFERGQVTARTYSDPEGWRRLFREAGYTGDYYWTVTE
jgi:ubiquinone/menaquinone biosynthesis C-methylase UbiE